MGRHYVYALGAGFVILCWQCGPGELKGGQGVFTPLYGECEDGVWWCSALERGV